MKLTDMGCFCLEDQGELFVLGDPVMPLNRKGQGERGRGEGERQEKGKERRNER
jgi:hypothetical protein